MDMYGKTYHCEECGKEISRDEFMENNGLCNDCVDYIYEMSDDYEVCRYDHDSFRKRMQD